MEMDRRELAQIAIGNAAARHAPPELIELVAAAEELAPGGAQALLDQFFPGMWNAARDQGALRALVESRKALRTLKQTLDTAGIGKGKL